MMYNSMARDFKFKNPHMSYASASYITLAFVAILIWFGLILLRR